MSQALSSGKTYNHQSLIKTNREVLSLTQMEVFTRKGVRPQTAQPQNTLGPVPLLSLLSLFHKYPPTDGGGSVHTQRES